MSATTGGWRPLPGWARGTLYVGLPLAGLMGVGYWVRASSVSPGVSSVAAQKGQEWHVPGLLPAADEHLAPQPQTAAPPKEAASKAADSAPKVRSLSAMNVYVDEKALPAVQAAAVERRKALTAPRPTGPDGRSSDDPNVLAAGGQASEYAQRMRATSFENITPVPPRLNKRFTIEKGYRISCVPDQPLSSEMVGPVSCKTDQPVLSMDDDHVNTLLPVGTKINGTIERGVSNGEKRLFPIWTDMLTPKPYSQPIPLGAPSGDEMGQPGLPGDVNTHFWLKARDLALVSVIQMLGSVASSAVQSGSGNNISNFNLSGPVSASQSLAERAFAGEVGQADTLYRGPGYPIVITTNKYIDLSNYVRNVPIR